MYDLSFNGTIIGKYIDNKEHRYPIVEIQENRTGIQKINLINDMSDLFEYLQKGDSTYKKMGNLEVTVHRNLHDSIFVIKIFCN
jgi:hypothetical protein